jgi:Na+/H+-dicarboxylate symporter
MIVIGVLIFSIVAPVASYGIAKGPQFDQGKLAASLLLVAWGSLLFGLILSRLAQ